MSSQRRLPWVHCITYRHEFLLAALTQSPPQVLPRVPFYQDWSVTRAGPSLSCSSPCPRFPGQCLGTALCNGFERVNGAWYGGGPISVALSYFCLSCSERLASPLFWVCAQGCLCSEPPPKTGWASPLEQGAGHLRSIGWTGSRLGLLGVKLACLHCLEDLSILAQRAQWIAWELGAGPRAACLISFNTRTENPSTCEKLYF